MANQNPSKPDPINDDIISEQEAKIDSETVQFRPEQVTVPDIRQVDLVEEISRDDTLPTAERSKVAELTLKFSSEGDEESQRGLADTASEAMVHYDAGARMDLESREAKDGVDLSNKIMRRGNFPTEEYLSDMGYYGFDVKHDFDKKETVYSQSTFGRLMLTLEKWFYRKRDSGSLRKGRTVREKITGKNHAPQIVERAKVLGQEQYFSLNDQGQVVEKTSDLTGGASLDDLLRFHKREDAPAIHKKMTEKEREIAAKGYQFLRDLAPQIENSLAMSARTVQRIHEQSGGGIGEVLCNDLILQLDNGKVTGVRLALPDVQYAEGVDALEQKATDLADFCFSAGSAGFQVYGEDQARSYIRTILSNYDDEMVKSALLATVPSRPHYGYITNRPRLGFDRMKNSKQVFEQVRQLIIDELHKKPPLLPQKAE